MPGGQYEIPRQAGVAVQQIAVENLHHKTILLPDSGDPVELIINSNRTSISIYNNDYSTGKAYIGESDVSNVEQDARQGHPIKPDQSSGHDVNTRAKIYGLAESGETVWVTLIESR